MFGLVLLIKKLGNLHGAVFSATGDADDIFGDVGVGVGGDDGLELAADFELVAGVGGLDQGIVAGAGLGEVVGEGAAGEDFFVGCVVDVFVVEGEFFEEFFAGADTGVDDGHFLFGHAGQADHIAGQVGDFDGLTHVEDEEVAGALEAGGLEDELGGFGDGHEIAGHVGVGDGDGSAVFDLFAEDGDDAAVGAEHVAEADGAEFGVGVLRVQVPDIEFGDAFGGTHDAGGVDGLVGGDQNEGVGFEFCGQIGHVLRSADVVFDGFAWVLLHHGNVFVGGGVDDDFGAVCGKDFAHALAVGDAGDKWNCAAWGDGGEFAVDEEQRSFGAVDHEEFFGVKFHDLAAQFRADRSAGAGDEDGAAG